MTATTTAPPAPAERSGKPTIGSLLSAELLRVRSRRFLRWSVIGLLSVMALVAVVAVAQGQKPTQAEVERATANCVDWSSDATEMSPVDEGFTSSEGAGGELVAPPPESLPDELVACSVREAAAQGNFDTRPALTSDLPEEVLGLGVGVAVLAFVLGCTLGGADWSHKTMAALLFWEPRRARVFVVKLAALLMTLVGILLLAQLIWIAIKTGIVATDGVGDVSIGSLTDEIAANLGRSLVLVLTMGAFAFGLASLTRNTGAALGVGFVYFAIVEMFVNWLLPRFAPWTATVNVGALMTEGGITEQLGERWLVVSSVQGGLMLTVYATVICLIGLELFRRRDVT